MKFLIGIKRIFVKEKKYNKLFEKFVENKCVIIKNKKIKICLTTKNVGFINEILKEALKIKKIREFDFENFSFIPVIGCSKRFDEFINKFNQKYSKKNILIEVCDNKIIKILEKAEQAINNGLTEKEILRVLGFIFEAPLIGPRDVVLSLSNICNLNCIYCEGQTPLLGENFKKIERNMLDFESVKELIYDFYNLGVDEILIIGSGEPTVHPNFIDIFCIIQKLGIRINLYSNGLNLNKKIIEEMSKFDNWEATLSISASNYKTYEELHPNTKEEDFNKLKENIKYLCNLNPEKKIYLLSVVNKLNFDQMEDFIYFAKELGVKSVKFQMVRVDYTIGTEFLKLDENQLKELPRKIERLKEIAKKENIEVVGDLFHEIKGLNKSGNWSYFSEKNPCYAGWMMSFVTEDKKINFCCGRKTVSIMNNKSFLEIWNSKIYNDFRIAAKKVDKTFKLPLDTNKKLIDEYCLHCDNLEINEKFKQLLEKSGLVEFVE